MNIKKKLFLVITIFIMLFNVSVITFAAEDHLDLSAKSKLKLILKHADEYFEDVEFTIYLLADAIEDGDDLAFIPTLELDLAGFDFSDLDDEDLLLDLEEFIISSNYPGVSRNTDLSGIVEFNELDSGLYLVRQTSKIDGYHLTRSFLLPLPLNQEGKWFYEVEAKPKMEIEEPDKPDKPDEPDKPDKTPPPTTPGEKPKLPSTGIQNESITYMFIMILGMLIFAFGYRQSSKEY